MIITSSKPYGVIKSMLKKWKKIGIASCNSCARACETGGREKMEQLAERLKNDGYKVVETNLIPMACNVDLAKKPDYESDVIVVLACDAGVLTFQTFFPTKTIIAANDTVGFGARGLDGTIYPMKKF